MAIMVGGGLTFAIPGMEPAYAAQINSNPNLKVSAEGQNTGNEIASTNIIEIIVSDGDVNASDDNVLVTVDGENVIMTFFSGAWYAYIAAESIQDTGLITPEEGDTVTTGEREAIDGLVTGASIDADDVTGSTYLVQTFDLDGEFDIVYEKPANAQTVTLDLDDPDSGVSLDRTNYSQGTDVVITIDDQALNVDPTDTDTWFFTTGGDPVYVVAGTDEGTTNIDGIETQANAQIARDKAIEDANAAHDMATGDAEGIRDRAIEKAQEDLDAVNDAIDSLPSLLTYGTEADQTTERDRRQVILDAAQAAYEVVDGRGDKNIDVITDTTNEHFKGTAHITFDLANAAVDVEGSAAFIRDAAINGTPDGAHAVYAAAIEAVTIPTTGISGFEAFAITDAYDLLECVSPNCAVIGDDTWVKFTEDDSNESTFSNSPDDVSSIKTQSEAQRGVSFSIEYDNTATSGVAYSTTNIVIDAGDEWNSGEEISITLTDSDANTNSLDANDLSVANAGQMLPTIEFGEPFTLLGIDGITVTDPTGDAEDPANTNQADTDAITATDDDTNSRLMLGGIDVIAHNLLIFDLGTAADVGINTGENSGETHVANFDVNSLGDDAVAKINFGNTVSAATITELGAGSGNAVLDTSDVSADTEVRFVIHILTATEIDDSPIVFDIFSFGLEDKTDPTSNTNDAIYRLELEEDGDNSSDFIGTLEYIGLNQYNILNPDTYGNIDALGDSIILISDDDSISVEYLDLDATGGETIFTAEANTPTHSGSVSLDSDGYKVADTVTVTVEDADLNVDSGRADVYAAYNDKIDTANSVMELLTVSIDGEDWAGSCTNEDNDTIRGLGATSFTLRETGSDSGIFTGTFAIPAEYCNPISGATSVTGSDISVEYVDFRDDSGSLTSVSASAGIRSSTGSVSLDRTVYPVPFSADSFATSGDDPLGEGTLTVYVSIEDSDFDESANGIDSIPASALKIQVLRGGADPFDVTPDDANISETAPDSGVFELEQAISYSMGPESANKCAERNDECILQGDILHVEYTDPSDASGSTNTVTDSATFDLRNGVLQSDQTAYVIGTDMIVTLIEQDLNLDSGSVETYDLDLIEWDSDAGTASLGDDTVFDVTPSNLLETGEDTGIFQIVVGIPVEIDEGDRLERGEEITLTYTDHGPSGADHVGDKDEEITTTVYTSNFGATIELDQRVYTWTDKVYVTVVAPDHNIDADQVDEIGTVDDYPVRVSTRGQELDPYKLVETGADTGIFTGEIILTGMDHIDADGDGNDGDASGHIGGTGPTDGQIPTESESGISVSFKYSDGETVSSSALIRWNVGEVQWLEASYPASGSGIVRVIDPDMNLNPEAVDNFDITVWSDSDGGGIDLTVTETNAATGIFEGTVFFGVGVDTSGHRLRVVEGDTVTAQYYDNTLPAPFKETERVRVGATTLIGTIVPPLERAPISDLRAVDSFGNTLDAISVDSQIQLAADVTNNQDKAQEFAYLIQIQNESGVTVSLDWIAGSLTAGQSLSPASSWTPTEAGTYEVTAFVWESIENPTALSPTATIAITVN